MGLRAKGLGQPYPPPPAHTLDNPRGGGRAPRVNVWTVHNWETGQAKPEIRFIPALVAFLGYDPKPVDQGTLAGRLIAKRRQLGLSTEGGGPLPTDRPRHLGRVGEGKESHHASPYEGVGGVLREPRHSFATCSRSRPMMERSRRQGRTLTSLDYWK